MTLYLPTIKMATLACALCGSGAEGPSIMAANSAIGFLLVVLLAVLGSFISFMVYLAKRARRFALEDSAEEKYGTENFYPTGSGC